MRASVYIQVDRKRKILMPPIVAWQEWCDDPVEGKDCHYMNESELRCGLFGEYLERSKDKVLRCEKCMEVEK